MIFIVIALILLALDGYLALKRPRTALLLSLPIIAGLFIRGVYYQDTAAMAISVSTLLAVILLCFLFAIIRLAKRPSKEEGRKVQSSPLAAFVKILFWVLLVTIFILFLPPLLSFFGILFMLLIWLIIRFIIISKRSTTVTVLSSISSAMRQNLPLSEALYAAGEHEDAPGRILRDIAHWLARGYSLSDALRQGYPRCPSDVLAMITLAERVNQVPLALKSIEADLVVKTDRFHRVEPVHPVYPFIVLVTGFFILMGVMIIVIPKFRDIFLDFDIELPAATEKLLDIAHWFVFQNFWLPWMLLAILAISIGTYIYTRFQPRRPKSLSFLSRLGDWIKWHLPVMHWYELNFSLLRTTAALRLCLNAGTTADDAIAHSIEADVNHCFRPRLRRWLAQVRQGGNIAKAARANRLGAPLAWAFDDNVNRGNTPQLLTQLESMYRYAYSYWVSIARFVFWPLCILALALIMGTVVYAMFMPIVAMIEGTLESCMM